MVTKEDIIAASVYKSRPIPAEKDPDIQPALDSIDQTAVQQQEAANFTYEVWDKTSPINGVEAAYFLSRSDVDPSSEIYLIKDAASGKVLYFQPHVAGVSGIIRMTVGDVQNHAQEHISSLAELKARPQIIDTVLDVLGV